MQVKGQWILLGLKIEDFTYEMDGDNGMPQPGMFGFGVHPNHPWGPAGAMHHGGVNMNPVPHQQLMGGPFVG